MSSIILDIILFVLIVLCIIIGIKRGAVKVILSLAAFFFAAYFAFTLSSPFTHFISNKFVEPKIVNSLQTSLTDTSKNIEDALPEFIVKNADNFGINLNITDNIDINKFVDESVTPIFVKVVSPFVMFIMFAVLSVVFNFAVRLLNKLIKVSLLGKINKTLGGIFGGITGCLIVFILCILIEQVIKLNSNGIWILNNDSIESSYLYKLFTNIF